MLFAPKVERSQNLIRSLVSFAAAYIVGLFSVFVGMVFFIIAAIAVLSNWPIHQVFLLLGAGICIPSVCIFIIYHLYKESW